MPGRSGLDVLADLRALLPNTPVLVISAFAEAEFAARALRGGAMGFMPKSNVSDELPLAVSQVLRGKKYLSPLLTSTLVNYVFDAEKEVGYKLLSPREFEVACLIANGKDTHEIAGLLSISGKTVATYRSRIFEKLSVRNPAELTRYAVRHRLVE